MKQISDIVNLAVRYKNKGKKRTVTEARDSTYLDKLVQFDEGYYLFCQLKFRIILICGVILQSRYKKKRKMYIMYDNLCLFKDKHFKLTGYLADWYVPYQ